MRGIAGMAFGISAHPYSVAMRWQRNPTKWQNFATTFFKKFLTQPSRFLVKPCHLRCARTRTRNGLFPEIPKNHEGTTMKKQINPSIKAHLLWSALMIRRVGALFLDLCSKNSQLRLAAFRDKIMQRLGFPLVGLIVFGAVALGLGALASASNSPEQNIISPASLQPSAATHETRAGLQGLTEFPNANEVIPRIETVSSAPPTRSSFMATWGSVSGAKGYFLDVSTSNSFSSYVAGYHDLEVGNVNGRAVTGLKPGTIYYYRVRPYAAAGSGGYSNVMTATTEAPTGLIINPKFDSSIINNPNSAAIQAMINRAIAIYESLFSDPITIQILFRYSTTAPNGDPLPPDVLSQSGSVTYILPWNDFISALRADARTSNDNVANASLPGSPLSTNIAPSSANGRAVGLDTPPAMFPNGTFGPGGPYDGIVTLNSAQPFWFTRPLISGSFDAQRSVEHEIDEVIGLGSYLNTPNAPRPCANSYEAESSGNTITGGAGIQSCPTCSGGADVGYVGNNSGTLQFNNVTVNTTHSYVVTIWYTNGDAVRYALLSVNGSPGTPVSFPSTGSFQTVGSVQRTITLNAGSNNTLTFYNPIIGNWAPDFDRIGVNCTITPPTNLRPQDLFSWSSAGVRNLTSTGSRYFSIDSGGTNIVGFNQTPPGDFGDWLSEACPQHHPYVQNAFACADQFSDISATSPEGINLDVIGYDLANAPPTPVLDDFNNDGHPDYLLFNSTTRATVIWYMHNNIHVGGAYGPTLPAGWQVVAVADFNRDGDPDYLLFNSTTRATVIWYMNNNVHVGGASGPTLPGGWSIVALADFNGDGYPDYVLFNASTHATVVWYMHNNMHVGGAAGPTLPGGWSLVAAADFNGDRHPDYLLFKPSTGQSVMWYMSGVTHTNGRSGPPIPTTYALLGVADFDGNGRPDYVLYNSSTHQTAIWYMNDNVRIGRAWGPTLPVGWSLIAP
jgi:elongation factor P hydroxylase